MGKMYDEWRYQKAKFDNYRVVLMIVGGFYETYDSDADLLGRLCNIQVHKRNGNRLAGFPRHKLDSVLYSVIRAGHRVQLIDGAGMASELTLTEVPEGFPMISIQYCEVEGTRAWEKTAKWLEANGYEKTGRYYGGPVWEKFERSPKYSSQCKPKFIGTDGHDAYHGTPYYTVTKAEYDAMQVKPILSKMVKSERWFDFDGILDKVSDRFEGMAWEERQGTYGMDVRSTIFFVV